MELRASIRNENGFHYVDAITKVFSVKGIPSQEQALQTADELWCRWLEQEAPDRYSSSIVFIVSTSRQNWGKVFVRVPVVNSTGSLSNWIEITPLEPKESIEKIFSRAITKCRELNDNQNNQVSS